MNLEYIFIFFIFIIFFILLFNFKKIEHFKYDPPGYILAGPGAIPIIVSKCKEKLKCYKDELKNLESFFNRLKYCVKPDKKFKEQLKNIGKKILEIFGINAILNLPKFPTDVKDFYKAITKVKENILFIKNAITDIPNDIKNNINDIVNTIKEQNDGISSIINDIKKKINDVLDIPKKTYNSIEIEFNNTKKLLNDFIKFIQNIKNEIKELPNIIENLPDKIIETLKQFLKNPFKIIFENYGDFLKYIGYFFIILLIISLITYIIKIFI